MFRLVALDIDGTLLRPDGSVSPGTREVLAAVASQGIAIVLVTARPPRRLHEVAAAAGLTGLAICQNGALTYDLDRSVIRDRRGLDPTVSLSLIRALKAALPDCTLAAEAGDLFRHEVGYESSLEHPPDAEMCTAEALADDRLTKLMVRDRAGTFDDLLRVVTEVVGSAAAVSHSGAEFVEVTAAGVTKLAALEGLTAELGIEARDVIAFGDMPIDLPMLRWAGRGVAMANSHPAVLAEISDVTATNDDDGVARVLIEMLRVSSEGPIRESTASSWRKGP